MSIFECTFNFLLVTAIYHSDLLLQFTYIQFLALGIWGLTKEQLSNLWVTRATYQLGWALYLYIKVYIDIFM